MPSPFEDKISDDLLLYLSDFLSFNDIIHLSTTCRSFSTILTRQLYVNDNRYGRHRALDWSCTKDNMRMLKKTLEAGACVNHSFQSMFRTDGINGPTPLMVAAERGHADIVEYLLEQGADVNRVTDVGSFQGLRLTVLQRTLDKLKRIHAMWKPNLLDIVRLLLEAGADPNLRGNSEAPYPLRASLAEGCPAETTGLLLEYGAIKLADDQTELSKNEWSELIDKFSKNMSELELTNSPSGEYD